MPAVSPAWSGGMLWCRSWAKIRGLFDQGGMKVATALNDLEEERVVIYSFLFSYLRLPNPQRKNTVQSLLYKLVYRYRQHWDTFKQHIAPAINSNLASL